MLVHYCLSCTCHLSSYLIVLAVVSASWFDAPTQLLFLAVSFLLLFSPLFYLQHSIYIFPGQARKLDYILGHMHIEEISKIIFQWKNKLIHLGLHRSCMTYIVAKESLYLRNICDTLLAERQSMQWWSGLKMHLCQAVALTLSLSEYISQVSFLRGQFCTQFCTWGGASLYYRGPN